MLAWLRARRRRAVLADPFPPHWDVVIRRNVARYGHLTPPQQARVRDATRILVAEKRFEGCGGLAVTPEMRVTVAAQAGLLLLADGHDYFARVPTVLLYPGAFRVPDPDDFEEDEVADTVLTGQAADRGPVVVSWPDALAEGRHPAGGFNVVVHEFAHQLDYLAGDIDGTPPLPDRAAVTRWKAVFAAALSTHSADLREHGESLFSEDAADPGELFADACEALFCVPRDLRADHPAVYDLLAAYFGVDAAGWPT